MKSNVIRPLSIVASLVVLILIVNSCKKDPYQVGINLLPPSDTLNIKVTDTAFIVAYTVIQDSVRTDETTLSIIGSLMDPIFGSTTAGFYMQYNLSAEAPDFGINPRLDSCVLSIPYGHIYGDSTSRQRLKVYEINQDFYYDTSYYSNHSLKTYGPELADYSFIPRRYDSLTIGGILTAPHIRVNLGKYTNYFGNKVLNAPASAVSTNANFLLFMKGLYIESQRSVYGGALLSFDPTLAASEILIYYHNAANDSLLFILPGSSTSARFNHFDHNNYVNASPQLRQQVLQKDTNLGRANLYVQGLGGLRVKIRLPFLKSFGKSGKIAINSAILTLKNAQTDTSLAPPVTLNLLAIDSVGNLSFLPDESEGGAYAGGTYHTDTRTYFFRITRFMQQVLDGKIKNEAMYIMANDPTAATLITNRVMFTGTKPQLPVISSDRINLQVIYTKLH
ncbi:MAG: DUF4270 domain-containing protein [Bacteroidales bacterium]